MYNIKEKVIIVTGAGNGIGKEIVKLLYKEGAYVIVTDIKYDDVKKCIKEIDNNIIGLKLDVTSENDWIQCIETIIKKYNKIDVLINNAGIVGKNLKLHEHTIEDWNKVIEINLTGPFLGMKHVIPIMMKNKNGSIINISSVSGMIGLKNRSAYCSSKGGLRLLTKSAAIEYSKYNIRVNSLHPGYIETQSLKDNIDNNTLNHLKEITPLSRLGTPEEVAKSVLYLASDDSSFITGIELIIDGGIFAQ
jgi:NAD(P)-dependent dehydrogenase (short-subunit alcohol dehydrogenase family)